MILRTGCLKSNAAARSDAFDVTRGSGHADGLAFAPSPRLFLWIKSEGRCGRLERAWPEYARLFLEEMRLSAIENEGAWRRLVSRDSATILCYCENPSRCHRSLLVEPIVAFGRSIDAIVHYDGEATEEDRG